MLINEYINEKSINRKVYSELPLSLEFLGTELNKPEKCGSDLERLGTYKAGGISCEELKEGKICFSNNKGE